MRGLGCIQVANGKYFLTDLESERGRQVGRFLDARRQTVPKSRS
jgi:hypothetical protein